MLNIKTTKETQIPNFFVQLFYAFLPELKTQFTKVIQNV